MPAQIAAFPVPGLRWRILLDIVVPLVTLVLILGITPRAAQYAVIVGGQSHFLMAYLYKYRAKGMTRGYIAFAALLALAAAVFIIAKLPFWYLVLFGNVIFSVHFAYDEFTLHGEGFDLKKAVSTVLFASIVAAPLLSYLYPHLFMLAPVIAIGLMFSWLGARAVRGDALTQAEQYLGFLAVLIALLPIVLPLSRAWSAAWFLVSFLHYLNWLFVYGLKVHAVPARRNRYWRDTVIVTGLILALFAWFWFGRFGLLAVLFTPLAFQLWTSAHVLLSIPGFKRKT